LNTIFWWGHEWNIDDAHHSDQDWIGYDAVEVDPMGYLVLSTYPKRRRFLKTVPNIVGQVKSVEKFSKGIIEIEFSSVKSSSELEINLTDGIKSCGISIKHNGWFSKKYKKRIKIDTSKISFYQDGKLVEEFETFSDFYHIELKVKNSKVINKKQSFVINHFNFYTLEPVC